MFRIKRVHYPGALYSTWLKITRMVLSCPLTDYGHVNGHDRTILVIFSQVLYKAP